MLFSVKLSYLKNNIMCYSRKSVTVY